MLWNTWKGIGNVMNKIIKKVVVVMLSFSAVLGLAACGKAEIAADPVNDNYRTFYHKFDLLFF